MSKIITVYVFHKRGQGVWGESATAFGKKPGDPVEDTTKSFSCYADAKEFSCSLESDGCYDRYIQGHSLDVG